MERRRTAGLGFDGDRGRAAVQKTEEKGEGRQPAAGLRRTEGKRGRRAARVQEGEEEKKWRERGLRAGGIRKGDFLFFSFI